jgi:hypothetical protein
MCCSAIRSGETPDGRDHEVVARDLDLPRVESLVEPSRAHSLVPDRELDPVAAGPRCLESMGRRAQDAVLRMQEAVDQYRDSR